MRPALVLPIRGIDPISNDDQTSEIDTVRPRASRPKGNGAQKSHVLAPISGVSGEDCS
jgi:hypothetical protein